ncbi:hypothetical protein [Gracilibacillus sp. YIM 98692]|uniref:hypothetical protein n=1 Tax=Gracilibacillus sp. YIM 98692 TaxID=2663532 RepID=UPI0013D11CB5|nr:hypothetical protein [Gracilibacillus sp. YIM 98692]
MKELLEEEFKDDPVRKEITIHHIDDLLYTDQILSMHPETSYSTTEASKIIKRSDSTIRNYFRTELVDYINPERHGKFYRLDFKSVFKLHMILLLMDHTQKATVDISYILGNTSRVSVGRQSKASNQDQNAESGMTLYQKQDMDMLKAMMVQQKMESKLFYEENILNNLYVERLTIEKEMQGIQLEKVENQQKVTEEKYYRMLDYSLKNTVGKKKEPQGFFSQLFKSKEEDIKVDEVLTRAKENSIEEEKYKDERQNLSKALEELKEKKALVDDRITQKKEAIQQIQEQIQQVNQLPDQEQARLMMNDNSNRGE